MGASESIAIINIQKGGTDGSTCGFCYERKHPREHVSVKVHTADGPCTVMAHCNVELNTLVERVEGRLVLRR